MGTNNRNEIQEEELIKALLNNDNDIIGNYLENQRHVAEILAKKYDHDDPENIASEAILATIEKIPSVKWEEVNSPKSFLFIIMRNFIIDRARQKRPRPINLTSKELVNLGEIVQDDERATYGLTGWHGVWDKDYLKKSVKIQPKHTTTRNLLRYFNISPGDYSLDEYLEEKDLAAKRQYEFTRNIIDTVLDTNIRERIEKYLRKFSLEKIANEEGISKQAVWKSINRFFKLWGWNSDKIKQLRMIWLVFALLDIKKQLGRRHFRNDYFEKLYQLLVTDSSTKAHFCNLPKEEVHYIVEILDNIQYYRLWVDE